MWENTQTRLKNGSNGFNIFENTTTNNKMGKQFILFPRLGLNFFTEYKTKYKIQEFSLSSCWQCANSHCIFYDKLFCVYAVNRYFAYTNSIGVSNTGVVGITYLRLPYQVSWRRAYQPCDCHQINENGQSDDNGVDVH